MSETLESLVLEHESFGSAAPSLLALDNVANAGTQSAQADDACFANAWPRLRRRKASSATNRIRGILHHKKRNSNCDGYTYQANVSFNNMTVMSHQVSDLNLAIDMHMSLVQMRQYVLANLEVGKGFREAMKSAMQTVQKEREAAHSEPLKLRFMSYFRKKRSGVLQDMEKAMNIWEAMMKQKQACQAQQSEKLRQRNGELKDTMNELRRKMRQGLTEEADAAREKLKSLRAKKRQAKAAVKSQLEAERKRKYERLGCSWWGFVSTVNGWLELQAGFPWGSGTISPCELRDNPKFHSTRPIHFDRFSFLPGQCRCPKLIQNCLIQPVNLRQRRFKALKGLVAHQLSCLLKRRRLQLAKTWGVSELPPGIEPGTFQSKDDCLCAMLALSDGTLRPGPYRKSLKEAMEDLQQLRRIKGDKALCEEMDRRDVEAMTAFFAESLAQKGVALWEVGGLGSHEPSKMTRVCDLPYSTASVKLG